MKASFVALIVVLFSSFRAACDVPNQGPNLHKILSARSSGELARTLAEQKRKHRQGLVCDVQLKTGKLPLACFALLKIEVERALVSIDVSIDKELAKSSENMQWLNDLCVNRASLSRDRNELRKARADQTLPVDCRKAVSMRAADLNYVDQSERPADLFRMRNSYGLN